MLAFRFTQPIIEHADKNEWFEKPRFWWDERKIKTQVEHYHSEAQSVMNWVSQFEQLGVAEEQWENWKNLSRLGYLTTERDQLHQALAALCVKSQEHLQMSPYPVQLMSALAMIDGHLVQLAPGEGKTLTIALVTSIRAWSTKPCHVITANDYLAQRDAMLMNGLYESVGLYATHIAHEMSPEQKREVYARPIVYGTAKQLLADYLHDYIKLDGDLSRMGLSMNTLKAQEIDGLLMRGLYDAIVDEADSILIDDATTPLIISAPQPNPLLVEAVTIAKEVVDELVADEDYVLEKEHREVDFLPSGEEKIQKHTARLPSMWHSIERLEELLFQAILARDVFIKDQHYVIQDDEVVIVDESTGRMMPGRTWSYGLHQAIEIRAGVPLTDPSKTMAKMSFQHFFKSYHQLCGASGTLQNVGFEMYFNYNLLTLALPTRLPSQLKVEAYRPYLTQEDRDEAMEQAIEHYYVEGRSVLVGTRSVSDSEALAEKLRAQGLAVQVLNAKFLEQEADIVAQAGQVGKVTIATNMAGRGTDIKLSDAALAKGGLLVLMSEPYDSARVDWQLFGRAGRQGQVGEAIALIAWDDKLIQDYLPFWWSWLKLRPEWFLNQKLATRVVHACQRQAEKKAFKRRKKAVDFLKDNKDRLSFIRGA